jgi:hypothetical protein
VTPCCSRHFSNVELGDEPELGDDPVELELHPATASIAVSVTAPMTAGLRDKRIKYCLLRYTHSHRAVKEAGLAI